MTIDLLPGRGLRLPAPGREPHRKEPFSSGPLPRSAPAEHDAPTKHCAPTEHNAPTKHCAPTEHDAPTEAAA
ncbi:hypothetical protein ACFWJ4_09010 [Kitasatospora sp. NPDC127067]|uniref:hypothetical protein n=1 Tax=Kitasatospora sp. NPDC127067 TaxID=3347126 RepID=UPI003660366D